MILVTGANGNFGSATIESLIQAGADTSTIAGMVRTEEKGKALKSKGIEVRIGDYDDYSSMLNAFQGIDKLLLVSGTDLSNRSEQQRNVIKAAKESGIDHILYTSGDRINDVKGSSVSFVFDSHLDTEQAIKNSGMDYTLLRNNIYLDMLPMPMYLGKQVIENGVNFPAGEGKVGFLLRSEMAEIAANILLEDGHENKEYSISHPQPVSFAEIADLLSEVTGKTVSYHSPDSGEYISALVDAGVPEKYASAFAGFAEAIKQGKLDTKTSDVVDLLGRQPTTAKQFLSQVYGKNS